MEAAAVAAAAAAAAARDAAVAASVAAAGAAKDAAVAAANAREATGAAKAAAAAASTAALKAEEVASTASAAALNAKEAADVAATAGEAAAVAAAAAAAAMQASKKRKFAAVASNAIQTAPAPVSAGEAVAAAVALNAIQTAPAPVTAASSVALNAVDTAPVAVDAAEEADTAVALNAVETAAMAVTAAEAAASAMALDAVEKAPVAVTAGEAAADAAAALLAFKKSEFHMVDVEQDPQRSGDVDDAGSLDLISHLPNTVLCSIVSLLPAKEAACTQVISRRWRPLAAALLAFKKSEFHMVDVEQDPQRSGDVDDAGSLDLISHLPNTVLCSIVSLLPAKEAACTQVISRRWRPLWHSTPLNLAVNHNSKDIDLISKILSVHPGPVRRFSLRLSMGDCYGKIISWLSSHALDKLQEFELIPDPRFDIRGRIYYLPSSVYRFAPTLRVAKFGGSRFSKLIVKLWLHFPCLKQLTLDRVGITEDALQSILSGCSALESLELKNNYGFARLCIRSRTLKSIGFCSSWRVSGRRDGSVHLKELVIEYTPCLERFLELHPAYDLAIMRVISSPKLKILSMFSNNIAELQFGTTTFQKNIVAGLSTKMHAMRVLFLVSVGPNLDKVINFLKCFPCLERLYVILESLRHPRMVVDNARKYAPLDPIECLELHLKKVELKNYEGAESLSVDFAKFFVLNAKVLREMKITLPYHRQHDWFANQHELLQIKDRASRDARIDLKCGTKACFTHSRHTHDLSMDDPFDMPTSGCSQCT